MIFGIFIRQFFSYIQIRIQLVFIYNQNTFLVHLQVKKFGTDRLEWVAEEHTPTINKTSFELFFQNFIHWLALNHDTPVDGVVENMQNIDLNGSRFNGMFFTFTITFFIILVFLIHSCCSSSAHSNDRTRPIDPNWCFKLVRPAAVRHATPHVPPLCFVVPH